MFTDIAYDAITIFELLTKNPDDFINILNNYLKRVSYFELTKGLFSNTIAVKQNEWDVIKDVTKTLIPFNELIVLPIPSKQYNPYAYQLIIKIDKNDDIIKYKAILNKIHYDHYPIKNIKKLDKTESKEIIYKYDKSNPLKYKTGNNYIPSEPGYTIFALTDPDGAMMMRIALVDGVPTAFRGGHPIHPDSFRGFQQWYGPGPYELMTWIASCWNLCSDDFEFYYEDDILALPE